MSANLLEEEGEEQRPIQQTLCGTLQRGTNWKCLILTLLIYGCLGAITWCRTTEVTKVILNFSNYPITSKKLMSPCDDGYIYIPVAFMVMLYMVYLVECWHCTTRIELSYKVDVSTVYEKIQQMRDAQPIIWWKAICYHYVRRSRQVTRYRNGDSYTTTQVYYERINSHAAGACFMFTYCGVKDISKNLVDLGKHPATKIRFSKGFAFANLEAATEFEDQRSRFFQEHERYDDYMEMREGLDLSNVNFKEYMIAYADPEHLPWYSNNLVFWIFSFFLLSWPLRVLIEYNTAHVHYQVTKLFGVNYMTPPGLSQSRGQLSHGSTIDSGDLEWCIGDNYTIVPSYSEALLMDSEDRSLINAENRDDSGGANGQLPLTPDPNGNIPNGHIPVTCSSYSIRQDCTSASAFCRGSSTRSHILHSNKNKSNRRSWGFFSSRSSLSRSVAQVSQSQAPISRSSTQTRLILYYPTPLMERFPADPFQGRTVTTPTEDPPTYEEALRTSAPFPALSRLRRSLTDRDICRRLREQRRSCIETTQFQDLQEEDSPPVTASRRGHAVIAIETSL